MKQFREPKPPPPAVPPPAGSAGFVRDHAAGLGAVAVIAAAVVAGWILVSRPTGPGQADRSNILLPDQVELVGAAQWVRGDLKAEALRDASLDGGLPLDDPELARRLARAFAIHPWVREVVSVSLTHPAAARVEIRCREPVAMVSVPGGLLAVDGEGIVLPSDDFTAESAARYPKITGIASGPRGAAGFAWGDPLVEEGAAIAAVIGPEWALLGLEAVRPAALDKPPRPWELVGPGERVIQFGSAPGQELAGEPTAAMKAARLRAIATAAEPAAGPMDLTIGEPEPEPDDRVAPVPVGP
ncbi:MAG: hypothetical protein RLZZ440_2191 [Planctomycetota bacterium]|jgi:hypothetical protein